MVVDDDEVSTYIIKYQVQKTGFAKNVITMNQPQNALDYFNDLSNGSQGVAPDLIFLDINMPVMNGWKFIKLFVKHYYHLFPNTKVCIISSLNLSEEVIATYHPCVISFIRKPLIVDTIESFKSHQSLRSYFKDVQIEE